MPERIAPIFLILALLAVPPASAEPAHWRAIGPEGASAQALSVVPGIAGAVYAVTGRGTVLASTDGMASWSQRRAVAPGYVRELAAIPAQIPGTPAAGGLPAGVAVYDLAADLATPGTLYAATSAGVYVTRNGGALWSAINDGLGDLAVRTVAVDPVRPGVVYAGNAAGLFELSGE